MSSIDLYPPLVLSGDLSPEIPPEIDDLCDDIHAACKGFGTDEDALIAALSRSSTIRTQIALRYEAYKGKNLKKLVDKECRGDFGDALEYLAVTPDVAEARMIRKATKGVGTEEEHLYPILCGRSNADMEALKKAYFREYDEDLASLLKSELTGDFEDFAVTCVQGLEETFDPDVHTSDKAADDADAFHDAGAGKWGTDEKSIFMLLCTSPPEHLKAVNEAYTDKHDVTLFKAFEKELRGDCEDAVLFTLGMKLRPYRTIAQLIEDACGGAGTDEKLLTACIVRYQNVLPDVMVAYMELFGTSVQERVRGECKSDYEKLLVAILNEAMPEDP